MNRADLELYVPGPEADEEPEPRRLGWVPVLLVIALVLAAIVWRLVRS